MLATAEHAAIRQIVIEVVEELNATRVSSAPSTTPVAGSEIDTQTKPKSKRLELVERIIKLEEHTVDLKERVIKLEEHTVDLKERVVKLEEHTVDLKERVIKLEEHTVDLKERVIKLEEHTVDLKERVVKLEGGQKAILERIHLSDQHIKQHFEQIERRLQFQQWLIAGGIVFLGLLMTLFSFLAP